MLSHRGRIFGTRKNHNRRRRGWRHDKHNEPEAVAALLLKRRHRLEAGQIHEGPASRHGRAVYHQSRDHGSSGSCVWSGELVQPVQTGSRRRSPLRTFNPCWRAVDHQVGRSQQHGYRGGKGWFDQQHAAGGGPVGHRALPVSIAGAVGIARREGSIPSAPEHASVLSSGILRR